MRLKADPDFEEIARCIRLARQEKCPGLRRRLLTLTREWIMLQCMGRRRVLPSMELQAPPYFSRSERRPLLLVRWLRPTSDVFRLREPPREAPRGDAEAAAGSGSVDYNPRAISAQWSTPLLLRNSMTPGSSVPAWSWGTTAVATIMSQRSLKATESADLPGRLRAVSA
jgi:hypothetical protein